MIYINTDIIFTVVSTILVFGLLIAVHELGHFIAAKKAKVKVNEFMIGMGPKLLKKTYGETEYSLRLFPIGGAVVMEGEDAYSTEEGSFGSASVLSRGIIVISGALMNFVLGFLLVLMIFIPSTQYLDPVIDGFQEGFKYEEQLKPGDRILSVDGYSILMAQDITFALGRNAAPHDILVLRDGEKVLIEDLPMERETFVIDGEELLLYGFNLTYEDSTFLSNIRNAVYTSANYARLVWVSLGDLITGSVGVDQLSGPIGVSVAISQTAEQSFASLLSLIALISINLGIMNLLPLPALDGGRLIFIIWEAIFKKPLSPKYEGYIHLVGFALLMLLTLFVTFNDIVNFIL